MHALGIKALRGGKRKQRLQDVAAGTCCAGISGYSESIAATGDVDVEPALDLSKVFVELPAQVGEAVIVGGLENDVPADLYGVQNEIRLPRRQCG